VKPSLLLLFLVACDVPTDDVPVHEGTAVGNPGKLGLAVGEPAEGVQLQSAQANVTDVTLITCDNVEQVLAGRSFDLLTPEAQLLTVPAGRYCTIELSLETGEGVVLGGTVEGDSFQLTMDPGVLAFDGDFSVDGHHYQLTLPIDSLEAQDLTDLPPDGTVGVEDPRSVALSQAVEEGLQLTVDPDSGYAAASRGDGGCGCATGRLGTASAWWLLVLVGWGRRRR
jgi:hypothetical protein